MKRVTLETLGIAAIAAFVLCTPGSALSDNTAAYLAARDRYIVEYKSRPADSPMDHPLADLDRRLKRIIPSWRSSGFPAEGRINLCCLQQDLGFGMLDGLRYQAKGTEVIVTTPTLIRDWIAGSQQSAVRRRPYSPTGLRPPFAPENSGA